MNRCCIKNTNSYWNIDIKLAKKGPDIGRYKQGCIILNGQILNNLQAKNKMSLMIDIDLIEMKEGLDQLFVVLDAYKKFPKNRLWRGI
ncbi:hypothetical protein GCM10023149_28740 [Mucilaginibacter gynuensis]|uniref:Uncharacterized protein n=1 Tax=Mucilaginibacter gynuensis TaxID=1302236 RepID=A0ABP8GKL5_9SPHI